MTWVDTARYIFDGDGRILVRVVFPHSRKVKENALGWLDQTAGDLNLEDGRTVLSKDWAVRPITQKERAKGLF